MRVCGCLRKASQTAPQAARGARGDRARAYELSPSCPFEWRARPGWLAGWQVAVLVCTSSRLEAASPFFRLFVLVRVVDRKFVPKAHKHTSGQTELRTQATTATATTTTNSNREVREKKKERQRERERETQVFLFLCSFALSPRPQFV